MRKLQKYGWELTTIIRKLRITDMKIIATQLKTIITRKKILLCLYFFDQSTTTPKIIP